jgi:hypothetical protein
MNDQTKIAIDHLEYGEYSEFIEIIQPYLYDDNSYVYYPNFDNSLITENQNQQIFEILWQNHVDKCEDYQYQDQ